MNMPRLTKAQREAVLPHVVVTGNPFDGLQVYGPFDNADDALQHAEETDYGKDWWIVPVRKPE
jgi:hypothetical protein